MIGSYIASQYSLCTMPHSHSSIQALFFLTFTHYARNMSWMDWHASSMMYPGVIGCFGSRNIIHPHPGDPSSYPIKQTGFHWKTCEHSQTLTTCPKACSHSRTQINLKRTVYLFVVMDMKCLVNKNLVLLLENKDEGICVC